MTVRFVLYEIDKISSRFAPTVGVPKGVRPRYNVSPTLSQPVILNRDGSRQIEVMKWGFIPAGAKDTSAVFRYKTFNARSEGILEKPTWMKSIRTQRCLVPANGFYAWKETSTGSRPFYIHLTDVSLFAFAGIYDSWTDPAGEAHGMFSIVTTDSGTDSDLVPSRLPVIVYPEDEDDWLNSEINDMNSLYKIMRPVDVALLTIYPVSDEINSVKVDKPFLINKSERS
jgi:putative SOS response-associated peptidase YedK